MSALHLPTLPDVRAYIEPSAWLAEWCAAQPERSTKDKVRELARFAGCSETTMHYVLRGERQLSPACAEALVPALRLPPEQAEHLKGIFELPFLPPRLARARREQLLGALASQSGLSWGDSGALIEDAPPEAATIAALSHGWAALEGDRSPVGRLLRCAIPPITREQLEIAVERDDEAETLAPRLARVRPPGATPHSALAHQGLLAFATDALLRVPSGQRWYQLFICTADAQANVAIEAACRRREAAIAELCHEAELRPADQVLAVLTQRLVVAGPFPAGASTQERWKDPFPLPPLLAPVPESPPGPPGRPHPTGITWFPTWIRVWRAWASAADHPCSDAWLAAQTGMSRSSIYDLCAGLTRFSSEHVFPFLAAFGFERDRAAQLALEGMAMVAAPGDLRRRAGLVAGLRALGIERGERHLATESHFVNSRWYVPALVALTQVPGFQPVPGWISRAFKGRIDPQAAREALAALGHVGLLRQDGAARVVIDETNRWIEGPHPALALFEVHHGLLKQLRGELDAREPDLQPDALLVGLPDKAMPRFQAIQERWRDEVWQIVELGRATLGQPAMPERVMPDRAPSDRVLIVSTQTFPLYRLHALRRKDQRARSRPPRK